MYARIASKYRDLTEISGRKIDDEGLRSLSMVSNPYLTSIEFGKSLSIKDSSITRLCKGCPCLKKLQLACKDSDLTDESVRSIVKYCPGIEDLSLVGWTKITDASMTFLRALASLKSLNLYLCSRYTSLRLTNAGVQSLLRSRGANLEELTLSIMLARDGYHFFDDALLRCIGECCPYLRVFIVFESAQSNVTEASFITLVQGCPLLETFSLWCTALTDALLFQLSERCPRLSKLSLSRGNYTNAGVIEVTSKFTSALVELELISISDLTDQSLLSIAEHCRKLRKLVITTSHNYTDRGLCQLFASCAELTEVCLQDLSKITDLSILNLVQSCPKLRDLSIHDMYSALTEKAAAYLVNLLELQTLDLGHCDISDQTLESLARYCRQLRTIDILGCTLWTKQGLIALLTHGKRLTYIHIGIRPTPEIDAAYLTRRPSSRRLKVDFSEYDIMWL